MDLVTS
jgi:hypothetical protein